MALLEDRRRLVRQFEQWQSEGVEQSAVPGRATFVQGDTEDGNTTILIVQSTTNKRITMNAPDNSLIRDLMNLAEQDHNRGLVRQIGDCKWAFYKTDYMPNTVVAYDPTRDSPAELWNRQLLSQMDLNRVATVNEFWFAGRIMRG